jgi:hypothetical protein
MIGQPDQFVDSLLTDPTSLYNLRETYFGVILPWITEWPENDRVK